ncbi:hypothetical protein CTAYLR_008211 [Chrysophaeum taylorii]|uniref:Alkyl transferase n=1 Tax=Chrysophaeum taylorii TaxID=2483200 RepID=A0AAD7UBE5_9STRA|nr:hypothetical protein CTAYLR_008211 [Chrysophaeum taylorii]
MDGNRRYGERQFGRARRLEGHQAGGKKLGEVVEWCVDCGVREVTCFAFSTENWRRDPAEIDCLMKTFVGRCDAIKKKAQEKRIRVRVLCTDNRLPEDVDTALQALVDETRTYDGFVLNLAVSYGSRMEIAEAAKAVATDVKNGLLDPNDITEDTITKHLQLPDAPDLLVRTSGERRISNFLLWQLAYTELVFIDKLWPDLSRRDFDSLLRTFANRHRRFGM